MKHPLWILNGTLCCLFIFVLLFIIFSRQPAPVLEEIEPVTQVAVPKKETFEVNIKKIYENDLFNTYIKQPLEKKQRPQIAQMPEPPRPEPLKEPATPTPQFFDPLKISLKGITSIQNDYTKNRAIIADIKTNKEAIYKVGDIIEDAMLVKIFSKKIILLRSNGQQEVLYLRDVDALTDPAYITIENWGSIAQKVADNNYILSIKEFTRYVKDLAQFITLFDLITVYQKGKSIGCRIGRASEPLLTSQFGLENDDIIVSINDIPATNTQNRLHIYNNLLALQEHDVIIVSLLRNKVPRTIHITVSELKMPKTKTPLEKKPLREQASAEQLEILQKRHSFAPTLEEIKTRERKNMLNRNTASRIETAAPITMGT